MYYNRSTGQIEAQQESNTKMLSFLYNTKSGRMVLWSFAARPWFSKTVARYHKSKLSHKDIVPFIEKHNINIDKEYAHETYRTFNDFFTRQRPVSCNYDKNVLISPADSKMRIYPITEDLALKVKNSIYSVEEIVGDKDLAQYFQGGTCIVFRLGVDDYHRYHFIDSGKILTNKKIPGQLHTVRPVSEKYKVFTRNSREVTLLQTDNFGMIAHIEVGALLVGKIQNHTKEKFDKMDEKGYFEFGGSTIIMLLNKDVKFDEDIVQANAQNLETKVYAGEKIGVKVN